MSTADLWQQASAFSFTADKERKQSKRIVAPRRAVLPDHLRYSLPEGGAPKSHVSVDLEAAAASAAANRVLGSSQAMHNLLDDSMDPQREREVILASGIRFQLPEWLPMDEEQAFAFSSAVVFLVYSKCGGADAVLVLDGVPPTAVLNPCSLAPLQDEPFAEIVSDVLMKRNPTESLNEGRRRLAEQLTSQIAAGHACIVMQRTVEMVGLDVLSQAFDVVFVVEYEGSISAACNLDIYYNSGVYRDASATNWLQMIQSVLITDDLNSKTVKEVSVLDDEMLDRLLRQWQPEQISRSQYYITAPQLFENAMLEHTTPKESICIVEPRTSKQYTYHEVDILSSKVAAYLQRVVCSDNVHRFGVDAACALHMPRCAEWYIWMLGILKAGGAYLSLDPDFPANRLSYILEDSGSVCLITLASMRGSLEYSGPVVAIDEVEDAVAAMDPDSFRALATPESPIYMIYTSGSTGKPKGVLVEHRNLVNFVLSERLLFRLGNHHRVIQGFSTSFDASLEEIWLAFASGSTLICVEKAVMQDAERLQELITATGATVLSTVPTLLATMESSKLRLLELVIVGGEACNKEVIQAYATGEKRMFANSYGPTEATVACCAAFCKPDEPVTIGRAQPGYVAYIVDEAMQLLPPGVPGELCIGGPSVTRGYVGRPELTREKFIDCPFHPEYDRMYRTGDLCRWNVDGHIEFLGRIDSQVKLRGFRIEIGEIETNLATFPGVTTAVVVLRNDAADMPFLCAYLICEAQLEATFSEKAFRTHLKSSLPSYMIPSRFVAVKSIPRSPAGKLDRKGFPPPPPVSDEADDAKEAGEKKAPSTETERMLHAVWTEHLPGQNIGTLDNFFEIGGHSLLAGKVSSTIRKRGYDGFSIRYLYSHPTIEELGKALDSMKALRKAEPVCTHLPVRKEPSFIRRFLFSLAHIVVMHLVFCVMSAQIVLFLYLYQHFQGQLASLSMIPEFLAEGLTLSLCFVAVGNAYAYVLVPLIKWIVIGKFRPGVHSIWSFYFLRWWAVRAFCQTVPLYFSSGTSWSNLYLRLCGMKVGRGVSYFPGSAFDFDLIELGDDCTIGHESSLAASEVIDSLLILRPIKIGRGSTVGVRCCVKGGAVMGDECRLDHVSLVHENVKIGDGELWGGSPAQLRGTTPSLAALIPHLAEDLHRTAVLYTHDSAPIATTSRAADHSYAVNYGGAADADDEEDSRPQSHGDEQTSLLRRGEGRRSQHRSNGPLSSRSTGDSAIPSPPRPYAMRLSVPMELLLMFAQYLFGVVIGSVTSSPVFGLTIMVWEHVDSLSKATDFLIFFLKCVAASPVAVAAMMIYAHVILIGLRWVVLPWKVMPGSYPVTSLMFHRKVLFDLVMRSSLTIAHPLYASIYVQYLLKLLGTEVGSRVECSNLYGFTPGLVKFGNETFVADFVGVNPPEIFRGVMTLGCVEIRDRAFVGNGAVLSAGRILHERSLLGLLSHATCDVECGSTYIGSPAFCIPRHAKNTDSGDGSNRTYAAPCHLVLARCLWEFMRCVTPAACLLVALLGGFTLITATLGCIFTVVGFLKFISLFVWISAFVCCVTVLLIKWVIVGREKPAQYPLWSSGVWRAEFVVDCTTVIGGTAFMHLLRGTPFMPWYFRALGSTIGSSCYIDTIFFTEPDMITMGDYCCIGDRVTMQTHLFEDRVMKVEPLVVGDRVSIGALSIILYNTNIERGSTVGPLSLVMKGESYPAGTHWEGIPAQRRPVPAVMAVGIPQSVRPPASHKPPGPLSIKRESRPSSIKPQTDVDVGPLRAWLLDDGLGDENEPVVVTSYY